MTTPRRVFLFTGHMVDRPGRDPPRFPETLVPGARTAIAAFLDRSGAGIRDTAMCGGACGGDLIFAEETLARGMRLRIQLAFARPQFIEQSVAFAGPAWVERFEAATGHANTEVVVTDPSLNGPERPDRFDHNNAVMLSEAVAAGVEIHFLALWNGLAGDGPGGTADMVRQVTGAGGDVQIIDPATLS